MLKIFTTLCILFFFVNPSYLFSQEKFTISGTIIEQSSGEGLIGAMVRVTELSGVGAITNEYGFYSLTIDSGNYTIQFSSFGLETQNIPVVLNQNIKLNIELTTKTNELEVVQITGVKKNDNVKDAQTGVEILDPKELAKLPVIFGERDIIKSMQLKPGVKSGGEGSSGFYVRGGSSDQNLILLDEAPVYNASHLLGFFSTFNSDALKTATLYKGSQPAQYGGRLASVLDVRMNEGNMRKFGVSGGIGLISSKLNIEGPILKDKASFLISGRRTYADLFLKLSKKEQLKDSKLFFYDLNTKINYKISDKDRLYLSGYFGRDKLGVSGFGITWGNATGTARWNHVINERLFSNTSFIVSNYLYDIGIETEGSNFSVNSSLQDYNLKQEFQYYANSRNKIKFGFNTIHHAIIPGQIEASSDAGIISTVQKPKLSWENAAFISHEWDISEKVNLVYGLRGTGFSLLGNGGAFYTFDSSGNVQDTLNHAKNDLINTYFNLEPRFSSSYSYSKTASLKLAYSRNVQNVHLISNSTSENPTDIWMPSSNNIKPEIGDQFSIGWFKNFKEGKYELSIESYYKFMQNQIDYRDGANTQANDLLEGELLYGQGRAYGAEFYIKKTSGKLTGWIGYTLARTEKQIDGINNNTWYAAKQDRTHDLSVVAIYDLSERLSLSGTFVFYTGNAVTFPTGKYVIDDQIQWVYSERNGNRMPDYHRMDIAATWYSKKSAKYESSWNFSIYNLYARENAYSISFQEDPNDPSKTQAVQTSLFKLIPSISYNFKF
jgi:hypothetical protein